MITPIRCFPDPRLVATLGLLSFVGSLLAEPPATPPPAPPRAQPETPREPGAYDKLPEVVKGMLDSAGPGAKGTAAFTPVAHVETLGAGPTSLVLIPGLGCDWTVWRTFMERSGEKYTHFAVTLPGFGGSNPPPMPDEQAFKPSDDVWLSNAETSLVSLVSTLKLPSPPIVVGHSMGGTLALRLACRHPNLFAGAISVDGFAALPITSNEIPVEARRTMIDNQMTTWFDTNIAMNDGLGLRAMFQSSVSDPQRGAELASMVAPIPMPTIKRYMLELMATDLRTEVQTVRVPVLALAAIAPAPVDPNTLDSRESIRAIWRRQFGDNPNAGIRFFEGSRHFIMEDRPVEFDESVAGLAARIKMIADNAADAPKPKSP